MTSSSHAREPTGATRPGSPVDALILASDEPSWSELITFAEDRGFHWQRVGDGRPATLRGERTERGRPSVRAIAARLDRPDPVTAAMHASALVCRHQPEIMVVCGTCGGRRESVNLGDVVVADRVFHCDRAKIVVSYGSDGAVVEDLFPDIETYNRPREFFRAIGRLRESTAWAEELIERRPLAWVHQSEWLLTALFEHADPRSLTERAQRCPDWADIVDYLIARKLARIEDGLLVLTSAGRARASALKIRYPDGVRGPSAFKMHEAPIATSSTERLDPRLFEKLRKLLDSVVGVDTNGASVGQVGEYYSVPTLIVKGVSHFCEQDDTGAAIQTFAAAASARAAVSLVVEHLALIGAPPLEQERRRLVLVAPSGYDTSDVQAMLRRISGDQTLTLNSGEE